MSGGKMETTKEALVLFLKSLPSDARFNVVSFGDSHRQMCEDPYGYEYNDKNVEHAI
jgi:hypothetical protein